MPNAAPVVAVLDDEPEMRKALRRLLAGRGFLVEEYQGGKELLSALSTHPMDVLLLDLHMPGIDGFDVLEGIRSRQVKVRIIVITAHDEPGTEERVRALGACAYFKKPVEREALFSAISPAVAADMKLPPCKPAI